MGRIVRRAAIPLVVILGAAWVSGAYAWEFRVCEDPSRMPFSNQEGHGLYNEIAEIIALELGAELTYVWRPLQNLDAVRSDDLLLGECDAIFGILDGANGFYTTNAFYRSPFAFIYREDADMEIASIFDEALRDATIGVLGAAPQSALRYQGLGENVVRWDARTIYGENDWYGALAAAVKNGQVDIGIAWGPIAGYYAMMYDGLSVVPVKPEIAPPFIILVSSVSIGLRPGDEALRDHINNAVAMRWDDIQAVLERFNVPLSPLPRPIGAAY